MKPNTPKQLTKRQKKAAKGPNTMAVRSITQGADYVVNGTPYRGRPAVVDHSNPYFNNYPGLPFIRMS